MPALSIALRQAGCDLRSPRNMPPSRLSAASILRQQPIEPLGNLASIGSGAAGVPSALLLTLVTPAHSRSAPMHSSTAGPRN
jgi:hypothetical protein